ncbi:MAG: HAD family phosphatase [Ruminococcaceae bacterium]|nr:HAD family phosphatase [Oscillospiraceae bacterium]
MDKRFAIFDMDGTLVDSMSYWRNLASEFLQSKGIPEVSPTVSERIRPMTMTESASLFIEEYGLNGTAESVAAEMNAMMDEHYHKDIPLKAGVASYLDALHLRGVTMCVASATAEDLMDACLTRLGVAHYFSFLLSCETTGVGKSRPDVYFEAAKRLGTQPEDIAVFEDALYAANTSKQAGFYTIAVRDDSNQPHWETLISLADEKILDWQTAAQTL